MAGVRLRLFSTMVDSSLSHGAEVWAVQRWQGAPGAACVVAAARQRPCTWVLRRLLGVQQAMPNGAVLLEAGERPLWARWLQRAGRLWNRLTAAPPGSLLHAAFGFSRQLAATAPATLPLARQSWAAQLPAALQGIGMPVDLARPRLLCLEKLKRSALRCHLHEIQAAAGRPGASKLAHYLAAAWGRQLFGAEEYVPLPAAYLGAVLQRSRHVALAPLRTGSHWLAEEMGRWEWVPRAQRTCPIARAG
jgi:hypothetical protein